MKYIGGKSRIKKYLHEYFNTICGDKDFVDLFCGSCRVIEGVMGGAKDCK